MDRTSQWKPSDKPDDPAEAADRACNLSGSKAALRGRMVQPQNPSADKVPAQTAGKTHMLPVATLCCLRSKSQVAQG